MKRKNIITGIVLIYAVALVSSALIAEKIGFPKLDALGSVPEPPDNPTTPEKVELGKSLFFDGRLSGDQSTACSACHIPTMGWQDNLGLCRGYPGTQHWRNCQTVVNSGYYKKLFWAGSSTSLEKQAEGAARGAVAGNGERDVMEERLAQVPEYIKMFKEVFGTDRPKLRDAWRAIASFERSLVQTDTPFDKYMRGDSDALTKTQKKGLALFEGKAKCIECHNGSFFTDEKYYNLGVPESPLFALSPLHQITFKFEQYAKGVPEDVYRKTKMDLGLYYRAKNKEDMGKFRTPTLRYLTHTSPYMHNGTIRTLKEVLEFYNRGGDKDLVLENFGHSTKTDIIKPLGLSNSEMDAVVEFLKSLSGDQIIIEAPKLPVDAVLVKGSKNEK